MKRALKNKKKSSTFFENAYSKMLSSNFTTVKKSTRKKNLSEFLERQAASMPTCSLPGSWHWLQRFAKYFEISYHQVIFLSMSTILTELLKLTQHKPS